MINDIAKLLLSPLAAVYTKALSVRSFLFRNNILKSNFAALPTFCVGNVVLGGSGKTPYTSFLCKELLSLGYKPTILLRGYKGKLQGPKLVNNEDSVEDVGDEAILHLSNNVPVIISRKRSIGVEFIKKHNLGNCVIMDDGLQHLAIKANHNFLLLDVSNESTINKWQKGKVLPSGYLREPLEAALERANSVVLVNKNTDQFPDFNFKKVFRFLLKTSYVKDLFTGKETRLTGECNIFSAIANPESFIESVNSYGLEIKKRYIYSDHQQITKKQWEEIDKSSPLLISSKDAVKLKRFINSEKQAFVLEQSGSICETSELRNLLKEVMDAK